jgi:hypothetical protein
MKAASHGAVHDAGQPHVDRTGCHARRPLGGITGAGRRGGSSAAGFRWPSLAFRSQIYYFRSSRESEASTCMSLNTRYIGVLFSDKSEIAISQDPRLETDTYRSVDLPDVYLALATHQKALRHSRRAQTTRY